MFWIVMTTWVLIDDMAFRVDVLIVMIADVLIDDIAFTGLKINLRVSVSL